MGCAHRAVRSEGTLVLGWLGLVALRFFLEKEIHIFKIWFEEYIYMILSRTAKEPFTTTEEAQSFWGIIWIQLFFIDGLY